MDAAHFFVAVLLLAMSVTLGFICAIVACERLAQERWTQMAALFLAASFCVATTFTIIREFAT